MQCGVWRTLDERSTLVRNSICVRACHIYIQLRTGPHLKIVHVFFAKAVVIFSLPLHNHTLFLICFHYINILQSMIMLYYLPHILVVCQNLAKTFVSRSTGFERFAAAAAATDVNKTQLMWLTQLCSVRSCAFGPNRQLLASEREFCDCVFTDWL